MLALTRTPNTSIFLSDTRDPDSEHFIKIHVVKASNGKVRIGIEAPENITILRGELVQGEVKCESN